jgi:hypothetical protein
MKTWKYENMKYVQGLFFSIKQKWTYEIPKIIKITI